MHTNNEIKCIVFDLDGTLIQSHETIYKSTIRAFEDLDIEYNMPEKEFYKYLGLHFVDIFEAFKINIPDFELFMKKYKAYYFEFIDSSKFYPGVEEVLLFLKENNYKTALLTTKAQDQADVILKHFKIDSYFHEIMGRRNGIEHKPSPEPLEIICKTLDVKTNQTMMVGDTEMDIRCGKNAGSKTCAVTFGYRTKEMISAENPDYIIDDLREIKNMI